MTKPKILIVEDHAITADGLGKACEFESMEPVVVYNGRDALKAFYDQGDIDIVILDIGLPDMNGYDVCRKMLEKRKVPILFMTARTDEIDEVAGLEMGGTAYLKKPVKPRTVVAHIRAVLCRADKKAEKESVPETEEAPRLHLDFTVNDETKTITYKGQPLDLTAEEYLILSHLIRHPGRVFSKEQITGIVDEELFILPSSVRNKIMRIRQKLKKVDPSCNILVTVHGVGYKLVI